MASILDTTLREGEQTPYVAFTIEEKIEIAKMLDKIGVDMIEAGDPSVSPKNEEAIKKIASLGLNAEIVAHSLAIKSCLQKAKDVGADRVVVLYPTSKIHLETKIRKTQEEALDAIKEHVSFAKSLGLKVRFTPEDSTRTEPDFLIKACNTAIKAGADRVSIADTLGVAKPEEFFELIKNIRKQLLPCNIDVHCHNDFGLALANSLAALRAGADAIHVTVNGIGERAGIPDLAEAIMALSQLYHDGDKYDKKHLTELSKYVEKTSGVFMAPNKPLVGNNSFTHKCGVHTDGVLKNPKTYEAIDPSILGRERKIVIDKYTSKRAVAARLEEYKINYTPEQLIEIVSEIKKVGDSRKIIHETDIIEIAESITGQRTSVIPDKINALVLVSVDSVHYTSSVVRKLRNFKGVKSVFEITGDHDVSVYVESDTVSGLNNLVEEFRTVPGIRNTSTRIILKKFEGNGYGDDS